ncbi:hypothetical protein D932_03162 [Enterococcus casseliflavus 14-MB-W-14]|nr:hypothetical protein D932_03162 [Enterococcus casseliflavus 14-MB-W-14]
MIVSFFMGVYLNKKIHSDNRLNGFDPIPSVNVYWQPFRRFSTWLQVQVKML